MSDGVDADEPSAKPLRLERLRLALAQHNWLSVAIEIAIVTVGVLLAFEIEQWGERRERAKREREFIEQLYADTIIGGNELGPIVTAHEKLLKDVVTVLRADGDEARIGALPRTPTFGCGLTNLPPAPNNDTNYEELLESERLSLLSDPALRKVIRDLAASRAMGAAQVESSREQLQIHLPPMDPYYRLKLGEKLEPLCNINWPALLHDQGAVNAANRIWRRHLNTWRARKRTYELTLRAQGMLACKLDKPECRR